MVDWKKAEKTHYLKKVEQPEEDNLQCTRERSKDLSGTSKQWNAQKRHLRPRGGRVNVHLTCKDVCWKVINLLCRLCLQFISFSRQPLQLLLQEINNVSQKRQISKHCFPTREFCISPGQGYTVQEMLCSYYPCNVRARPPGSWFAPDSAPLSVLLY